MVDKILNDVFVVELKWGMIRICNKVKNINECIKIDVFRTLLLQSFDSDACDKIMDAILSEDKLIIDFKKEKVKKVEQIYSKYEDSLLFYMNSDNIQLELDDGFDFYDVYSGGENG